jgi:dTDP-4-amino-4,6-dideoxygalactose transaminase
VTHAVLTISGTVAPWLIFRALGLGPGDEVLVPADRLVREILTR